MYLCHSGQELNDESPLSGLSVSGCLIVADSWEVVSSDGSGLIAWVVETPDWSVAVGQVVI